MRGGDRIQSAMFSYLSPETRVRKEHPLRAIRAMVDSALREMSPLFDDMYSELGRPSIAPEKLLRAQLLQMLYSVRSERLLMEEIDYSVLFRWFVGMNMGRAGLGCNGIHEEPGPAIGTQRREGVFRAGVAAGRASESDFGRAFHRGRYAAGSWSESEELPEEGRSAARRSGRS